MKTKLTMVSVWFRGQRLVRFVQATVDENGKAHIPMQLMHDMAASLGCPVGGTYTSG